MASAMMHEGSCLCGAVRFTVEGELPAPDGCHCVQCRKSSGHYLVSSDVPRERVRIDGEAHVRWYRSSDKVRRGFCDHCGATLFFDPLYRDWIGISMGAFDGPTRTRMAIHIYMAEKGDYYDIADGLPQKERH